MTDERFWAKVERSDDCWLWRGGISSSGYGHLVRNGVNYMAHRYAYEQVVGPIPEGLVLDHLCRVPPCVNPAHLEPVTNAENLRRGVNVGAVAQALQRAKTHCPQGHAYDDANTYVRPGPRACRECRKCHTEAARRYNARKRAARQAAMQQAEAA